MKARTQSAELTAIAPSAARPVPLDKEQVRAGIVAYLQTSRERTGMTLQEVAVLTGLNPTSMSQWERGVRVPTADSYLVLDRFYKHRLCDEKRRERGAGKAAA